MKRILLKKAIDAWKNGDQGQDAVLRLSQVLKDTKHILPGWSPTFLRGLGDIKTVIDVGVLKGTPSLYKAFPEAYLILVEALPNYKKQCQKIIANRPGEIHMVAAGSTEGEIDINFLEDVPARSSLLTHVVGGSNKKKTFKVPMRRLDGLLGDRRDIKADILLKIDTEGYEMEVIKGAEKLLPRVKYVIAETSVRVRHKDSYRFADLVGQMKEYGFDVFDMMTTTRMGVQKPGASIVDVVFINTKLLEIEGS